MQIENLKPDFRGFDFLLFLGIKFESNHYIMLFQSTYDHRPSCVLIELLNMLIHIKILSLYK